MPIAVASQAMTPLSPHSTPRKESALYASPLNKSPINGLAVGSQGKDTSPPGKKPLLGLRAVRSRQVLEKP